MTFRRTTRSDECITNDIIIANGNNLIVIGSLQKRFFEACILVGLPPRRSVKYMEFPLFQLCAAFKKFAREKEREREREDIERAPMVGAMND